MIKFRVQLTGKNAQGVAVVKREHVFEADLKCGEDAEREVLDMVAKHIGALAVDLEAAAADALLVARGAGWRPLLP